MPEISVEEDHSLGHDLCPCPPRGFATSSRDTFAEGYRVARQGDSFEPHGCPAHPPHSAVVRYGWQTVLVNQRPVACVTATVTCASNRVGTGRPSVLVGEGSRIVFGC
jgi:uncharacterized Zn-binding protein involved in type VI secretion